jgi:hypothetical protein
MPDISVGARVRLLSATAALSTVLVGSASAGFVVGMGGAEAQPSRAGAAVRSTDAADLPLRVPAPTVTMAPRPSAAAPAVVGPEVRVPTAAERDRELAALLASSGNVAGPAAVPTPPVPTTAEMPPVPDDEYAGTSADLYAGTGTDPGTDHATGTGSATGTRSDTGSHTGRDSASGTAADFVVSSFNVLGSSHTRNGGRGRASGVARMQGAVQLLQRHDVDVVGFQELQSDQARELLRLTDDAYALYPGAGAGKDSDNSIGWRASEFRLVRASTVSIPYFNGHRRRMPLVLLQHKASGVSSWFANFHNPAETSRYRHQQRWRTEATAIQAALANRLHPAGVPLFITGDMNERAAYFCRLTSAAPSMAAAHGGSNGSGGCHADRPRAVDWILATRGVTFSGYGEDRTPLVARTTDHPVITTRVRVGAAAFPRATGAVRP